MMKLRTWNPWIVGAALCVASACGKTAEAPKPAEPAPEAAPAAEAEKPAEPAAAAEKPAEPAAEAAAPAEPAPDPAALAAEAKAEITEENVEKAAADLTAELEKELAE